MDINGANRLLSTFIHSPTCFRKKMIQAEFSQPSENWVGVGGESVEAGVVKEGFWEEAKCEASPLD